MRLEVPVKSGATADVGEHGRCGPGAVSGGLRGGDDEPGGGVDCREELLVQPPACGSRRYMPLGFLMRGGQVGVGSFPFFIGKLWKIENSGRCYLFGSKLWPAIHPEQARCYFIGLSVHTMN